MSKRPLKRPLSPVELEALKRIEIHWHRHHQFPDVSLFEDLKGFNLDTALRDPIFKKALANRGITVGAGEKGLSDAQVAAVLTIANYADRRSFNAKLRDLGIKATTWSGWLKDERFREFLQAATAENFKDALPLAQEGLLAGLRKGDTSAIKFYYEVTGLYRPGQGDSNTVENLKLVVVKLVESIQRHVRDPLALERINEEFRTIISGEQPVERPVIHEIDVSSL